MFFLRCIFWLSIVYASMSWTNDALAPSATRDHASIAALGEKAVDGVVDLCRRQPAQCLADAAKLSALIESGVVGERPDQATPRETIAPVPPMPVPDPRRHARDAELTRTP